MNERETNHHWPLDAIRETFQTIEIEDVLFGHTLTAHIGDGNNHNLVSFPPEIEAISVTRKNSTRQYHHIAPPPQVVEGGVLFQSADGDEHVFIKSNAFLDVPLFTPPS